MKLYQVKWYIFLLFLFALTVSSSAQCISFARNIAKPKLAPFVHDGNYNAAYMEEGESAELYKTFFQGEEYRLVVTGIESLPRLRIRLLDDRRDVVFDNADHNFVQEWDFTAYTTGTMIVQVRVTDDGNDNYTGGCVAIMFGVKASGRRR